MQQPLQVKLAQAETVAACIAEQISGGTVLALSGPLGSGKTTFAKALARALSVRHPVNSPTFVIMNRYEGKLSGEKIFLYHLDLYRTKNFSEVASLGITELWQRPEVITVIEWADKITGHLPPKTLFFEFTHL